MQSKKFTLIYCLFIILLGGALLTSFSSDPPPGRSGAPGDGLCTDCHATGNPLGLDGELTIDGFPEDITPGETYTITITARNENGLAQRNGFQAVILDSDDNNSGDIIASGNPDTETFNGREYVEHRPAVDFVDNMVSWDFDWVAPDDAMGEQVTLYVASIIGSGTNGNGSDLLVQESSTATIMITSATHDLKELANISVFPNPATEQFTVEIEGTINGAVDLNLVSVTGKSVYHQQHSVLNNSRIEVPVAGLAAGIYFLNIKSADEVVTKRVVVQ